MHVNIILFAFEISYIGGAIGNRHVGGSDAIWLDDVKCNGTEGNIENCLHKGWGVHDCGHGEDVSISCGKSMSNQRHICTPCCIALPAVLALFCRPSYLVMYLFSRTFLYFRVLSQGSRTIRRGQFIADKSSQNMILMLL